LQLDFFSGREKSVIEVKECHEIMKEVRDDYLQRIKAVYTEINDVVNNVAAT